MECQPDQAHAKQEALEGCTGDGADYVACVQAPGESPSTIHETSHSMMNGGLLHEEHQLLHTCYGHHNPPTRAANTVVTSRAARHLQEAGIANPGSTGCGHAGTD